MLNKIIMSLCIVCCISSNLLAQEKKNEVVLPAWFESCSFEQLENLLKDKSFDVNMKYEVYDNGFAGETPLMHAVKNKDPRVTELLLKAGADVNAKTEDYFNYPAIVFAVQNPNIKVLKLLYDAGADIKYKQESFTDQSRGRTLLHFAAANPNTEVFLFLLARGVDLFVRDEIGGNTVLLDCAGVNQNPEVIDLLLKSGLKINDINDFNETALMIAAGDNSNPAVIELLMDKGSDLRLIGGVLCTKSVLEYAEANPALADTLVLKEIQKKFAEATFFTLQYFKQCYSKRNLLGMSVEGKLAYVQWWTGAAEPADGNLAQLCIIDVKVNKVIDKFPLVFSSGDNTNLDYNQVAGAVNTLNANKILPMTFVKVQMSFELDGNYYKVIIKNKVLIVLVRNGKEYCLTDGSDGVVKIFSSWLSADKQYLFIEYLSGGNAKSTGKVNPDGYYNVAIFNLREE